MSVTGSQIPRSQGSLKTDQCSIRSPDAEERGRETLLLEITLKTIVIASLKLTQRVPFLSQGQALTWKRWAPLARVQPNLSHSSSLDQALKDLSILMDQTQSMPSRRLWVQDHTTAFKSLRVSGNRFSNMLALHASWIPRGSRGKCSRTLSNWQSLVQQITTLRVLDSFSQTWINLSHLEWPSSQKLTVSECLKRRNLTLASTAYLEQWAPTHWSRTFHLLPIAPAPSENLNLTSTLMYQALVSTVLKITHLLASKRFRVEHQTTFLCLQKRTQCWECLQKEAFSTAAFMQKLQVSIFSPSQLTHPRFFSTL